MPAQRRGGEEKEWQPKSKRTHYKPYPLENAPRNNTNGQRPRIVEAYTDTEIHPITSSKLYLTSGLGISSPVGKKKMLELKVGVFFLLQTPSQSN